MSLLDSIQTPEDLKRLPRARLPELAADIRKLIVEVVSRTGGHLASSLGAVDLAIAIHLVVAGGRGMEGAVWGYAAGAVAWAAINLAAMARGVRADVPERGPLAERYQGAMAMALANVIISEVSSLKRMVDEFSKYARMPAPQMARQSLHDVVRDVVALYQGAHRDVQSTAEMDETLPYLNFDREQINRVFVSLLDNAVQAKEQRGRVWITTRHDAKRRRAVVTVAHDGPGINPEDQDKLFIPYFPRKRTGTGLGLLTNSMAYRQIQSTAVIETE